MTEQICIPDIENYTLEIINRELILIPKKIFITEKEFRDLDITFSKILICEIKYNEYIISKNTAYRGILIDIWKSMPTQKIFQNTTFNFKLTNENNKDGYHWCNKINMSFQNKNANGMRDEILNMLNINNYNIEISIKLKTGKIIHFRQ